MSAQPFLQQITGRYEVLERGRIIDGVPGSDVLSMYFPPVGTRRDLRAAEIDGDWVAKFEVELPPMSDPFPMEPKIEDAIYRVAGANSLFCDRIDVEPNLFITDAIEVVTDAATGLKALHHHVNFFNAAGAQIAAGCWICPQNGFPVLVC